MRRFSVSHAHSAAPPALSRWSELARWIGFRARAANVDAVAAMPLDPEVASLDLLPVEYLLKVTYGWSRTRIARASLGYRAFLQLIRNGTMSHCVPSMDVDRAWETHMLLSEKYFVDTQRLFGEYLHHWPFSGRFDEDDAAEQLQTFHASQRALDALRAGRTEPECR